MKITNNTEHKARADAFLQLHQNSDTFVMPCAWDAFSAIVFEQAGFQCIGTTSGGVNWVRGRKDYIYSTPMEEMLDAYGDIAIATRLPVSADLENGYAGNPEGVADTISGAIDRGIVGGSIEDQRVVPTDDTFSNGELYDTSDAVARIRAARLAADATGTAFTLTARCEVYYTNSDNPFKVAVDRLHAYKEAGADCLFVPGLNDLDQLADLVKELDAPITFGMGASEQALSVAMLNDIGVRRVSTGGGLTRATFGLLKRAAQDMALHGVFDYLDDALTEPDIVELIDKNRR